MNPVIVLNPVIRACRDEDVAAVRLGNAEGAWDQVWRRFREAPRDYPNIPDRLRQVQPSELLPTVAMPTRIVPALMTVTPP